MYRISSIVVEYTLSAYATGIRCVILMLNEVW